MDISNYLTQQAAGTGQKSSASASTNAQQNLFDPAAQGLSFIDLIFATQQAKTGDKSASAFLKSISEKTIDGSLIQASADIEAAGDTITSEHILDTILQTEPESGDQDFDYEFEIDLSGEVPAELQAARSKLKEILESLIKDLPSQSKSEIYNIDKSQIKNIFGRIQGESDGDPSLIATGLDPEALTDLLEKIASGEDQAEQALIGLIKITPESGKKDVLFLPRGRVVSNQNANKGDLPLTAESRDELAARLNALTIGGDADPSLQSGDTDFEDILELIQQSQGKSDKSQGSANGIDNIIKDIKQKISAGLSTFEGKPPALSAIFSSFAVDSIYPEGADFNISGTSGSNLSTPMQLTSMISHVQQAGMPHPATQMVANVIAKATNTAESKNITIQLDPPDLGRVKISLEFSKENNTLKAILTAEKPETHMMLQRDAHVLERALQEAGLDSDGSSLEFELSQDGNMFEQDQHSTGGNSGGGSDSADGEENIEIIETTMDWYVDPNTGLTRYDALV